MTRLEPPTLDTADLRLEGYECQYGITWDLEVSIYLGQVCIESARAQDADTTAPYLRGLVLDSARRAELAEAEQRDLRETIEALRRQGERDAEEDRAVSQWESDRAWGRI
jgi:hypothetical protein